MVLYGFDTGFVCYAKGWREVRKEDRGTLWELCVLNELYAKLQTRSINYWRNKKGQEIDFVVEYRAQGTLNAIECKFSMIEQTLGSSSIAAIAKNFNAFRHLYQKGKNFVVAGNVDTSFEQILMS